MQLVGKCFTRNALPRRLRGNSGFARCAAAARNDHRSQRQKSKKGATGADSDQEGNKVKMSKGVAVSELLMHLGRGEEENNNMEVTKKRTTLIENSAVVGDDIQTPGVVQDIGNRRPARSSAKKAVGWYCQYFPSQEAQEEQEQTRHQQLKCKDCKLGFSSSYKLRRYFSTSLLFFYLKLFQA